MTFQLLTRITAVFLISAGSLAAQTTVIDFESALGTGPLGPNTFFNGGPTTNNNPLSAGSVGLNNSFTDFGGSSSWAGWSFSNVVDTTTAGFTNQYAAFPGSGADHSSTYAVGYESVFEDIRPTIDFGGSVENVQISVTNTTYAYRAIFGDVGGFGTIRDFGDSDGVLGNDGVEDTFILQISGFDETGAATGVVDFFLADYRFANNADDFVIDEWTNVDLSALGQISSLEFSFLSTDVGTFGINTPTYLAIDNLSFAAVPVPEPASGMIVGLIGLVGCLVRKRHN